MGIPIIPTTATFNISFDSSFCSFSVVINDSTGTGLGGVKDSTGTIDSTDFEGSWSFTTGDGTFAGSFDTAAILLDTSIWATGGKMLYMAGFTNATTDSAITLICYLPTGAIVPGTYNSQTLPPSNSSLFAFNFTTGNGDPIYEALPDTSSGSNITINIVSYDATTHIVTGTFSGLADDANDVASINVIDGSFKATVAP